MDKKLVSICGIYCGACQTYRTVHDSQGVFLEDEATKLPYGACQGCHSEKRSKWCEECEFRVCSSERGIDRCSDCAEFPCQRVMDFESDGIAHHRGITDSSRSLREKGMEAWLAEQVKRWSCACGEPQAWYSKECASCGQSFLGLEKS